MFVEISHTVEVRSESPQPSTSQQSDKLYTGILGPELVSSDSNTFTVDTDSEDDCALPPKKKLSKVEEAWQSYQNARQYGDKQDKKITLEYYYKVKFWEEDKEYTSTPHEVSQEERGTQELALQHINSNLFGEKYPEVNPHERPSFEEGIIPEGEMHSSFFKGKHERKKIFDKRLVQ